ncbi:MAG: porphobilinogen synthase, partial [Desulfobulbaceae bacterium]|nr:porphobilinogen synthase [Desulfobulbaceae bacterium]
MVFPEYRPRRLRKNEVFRSMIRETSITPANLIYPLFVMPGKNVREEVSSMPGVFRISVDQLGKEAKECMDLGINNVILFGLPESKDPVGSGAHAK